MFFYDLVLFQVRSTGFPEVCLSYLGEPQKVLCEGAVRIIHFYDGQLLLRRDHNVIIFIKHTRYVQTPTGNMQ